MKTNDSTREVWCRNIDSSYKGVAAEVDLMMKITNSVFISVGCNTVNFKYLDLNAGLGVFLLILIIYETYILTLLYSICGFINGRMRE